MQSIIKQSRQVVFLSIFVLFQSILYAQGDTHYWSIQYGARSALLGGAVIAGLDDNSSVFYNPANIAFIKKSKISLNTSVYKYDDFFVGNGAGKDVDLTSQRISLYQQMVSGLLTKNPEKPWRLGFNILARQNANIDINQRHQGVYEIINDLQHPGMEEYVGNIELRNTLGETWGCLALGVKINEYFAVGLTAILAYRSQKHTFAYSATVYNGDSLDVAIGGIEISTNTSYFHSRTNIFNGLLKAGFHGRIGGFRFGLNVTSPSLTIFGESRVQREVSQTNIPVPGLNGTNYADRVKTEEQKNLKSTYKYPLSIGTGIAYVYKTGLISISAEYFMAIGQYKMIESDPNQASFPSFLPQSNEDFLTVFQGADAVLNGAIGWEQKIADKIKLHLGVRSDFSYVRSNDRLEPKKLTIVSAPVDIWHFSAGVSWRRKASLMSVGLNYGYAHRNEGFSQLINFTEPLVKKPWYLFGENDSSAYVNYHSITLLIGYTYYFALK